MSRNDNYSLVLLAGGKSSRMGSNKAELILEGKTFTQILLKKAECLGIHNILISGHEEDGVKTVWDIYPQIGPLGGIHACMNVVDTPYCLILPVDVPQIPVSVLEALINYHENKVVKGGEKEIPVLLKHGERRENLIGIYPVQMKPFIEERIKENRLSVHSLLEIWGHCCFETELTERLVQNINTRENYEELLRWSEQEKC